MALDPYSLYIDAPTARARPISIAANLPDSFEFSITSDYDTPFASLLQDKVQRFLPGAKIMSQLQTAQIWQGSAPIEISLPILIAADRNPRKEIVDVVADLFSLVLPYRDGRSFLRSPGPRLAASGSDIAGAIAGDGDSAVQALDSIGIEGLTSIHIGNFVYFPNVVITNVSNSYETMFDVNGKPMKATLNVTFRTFLVPTYQDIDKIFLR